MKSPSFKPKKIVNHDKDCWQINIPALYSPKGKRERRIFQKKSEAEEESRRLKEGVKKHGTSLPTLPHETHAEVVRVIEKLQPLGIRLEEAVDEYLERKRRSEESITFADLIERVADQKEREGRRPKYVSDIRQKGGRFLPFFGNEKISDIRPQDIEDAISKLNVSSSSQKIYRRYLRLFFNQAVELQILESSPIPKIRNIISDRPDPAIFTPAQVRRLLNGSTEELLPYYVLAVFVGIRPTEISRLNWSSIDFEEKAIDIKAEQSKTKIRRLIELEETAFAWLEKFRGISGPIAPTKAFRAKFDQNRKDSGLFSEWSNDVLRHTCATYHATFHRDYGKTAFHLGHDVATLKRHYFQPVLRKNAEAFWNLRPEAE